MGLVISVAYCITSKLCYLSSYWPLTEWDAGEVLLKIVFSKRYITKCSFSCHPIWKLANVVLKVGHCGTTTNFGQRNLFSNCRELDFNSFECWKWYELEFRIVLQVVTFFVVFIMAFKRAVLKIPPKGLWFNNKGLLRNLRVGNLLWSPYFWHLSGTGSRLLLLLHADETSIHTERYIYNITSQGQTGYQYSTCALQVESWNNPETCLVVRLTGKYQDLHINRT